MQNFTSYTKSEVPQQTKYMHQRMTLKIDFNGKSIQSMKNLDAVTFLQKRHACTIQNYDNQQNVLNPLLER